MTRVAKMVGVMMVVWSCFQTAAAQQYVGGKVTWDGLNDSAKRGYVLGAFDAGQTLYQGSLVNQYVMDIGQCVLDMQLSAHQLVEIVESEYSDLSKWDESANALLQSGLRKVCLGHMNRARAARGDKPIE